jgi:glycyl-tRNA synthetase beta subunit
MTAATLLVELLTEELPPKALPRLGETFATKIAEGLKARGLAPADAPFRTFASPRRLAVTVAQVASEAAAKEVTEKLMPVSVALDAEGKPTPALLKKMAAKGIPADSVDTTLASFERRMDGKAVTALVEHPTVYVAQFEPEFLAVPQECLILTMKANQKYFPLLDADGRLLNRFLVVSNMHVADPHNIVSGNERVVRARLSDARFFFEQDKKTPLAGRITKMESVVYHNRLGSQFDRVMRIQRLSAEIAGRLDADVLQAARAGLLAKADLATDMVGEFPELQGVMGRYYAQHDGESDVVAAAVEQHYRPRFAGDALPQGAVACAVSLADKIDALVGFFGIGQIPTGDKDPFALRRAALGILRILMETALPLDLAELIQVARGGFRAGQVGEGDASAFSSQLLDFMHERLRNLLKEAAHDARAIDAVLALKPTRIDLVPAKLAAVVAFSELAEAQSLAAANKRIVNILKKAERRASPTSRCCRKTRRRRFSTRSSRSRRWCARTSPTRTTPTRCARSPACARRWTSSSRTSW